MAHRRLAVVLALLAGTPIGADASSRTPDWPSLRGPNFDGSAAAGSVFRGPDGADLAVSWRAALGPGYSGVAVSGGRAVTLFSHGRDDVAAAFDAASGKELWRTPIGPTYQGHDGSFDGPISTPAIAEGRVFAFGPRGHLLALELASGRVLWQTDIVKDHGGKKPYYGFGASLLVAGGTLVVETGGEGGRAIAGFDPASGKRRWTLGDDAVSYQSPVALSVGGREQVVAVGNSKLFGVEPGSGRLLWSHDHGGEAQPIAAERGRIEAHELPSAARPGTKVSLQVYLPAGYEGGTQRVPVAYVLGGDQARTLGAVPRSLDNMIGRSVEPLIAVFVGRIDWGSQRPRDDDEGDAEAALVANEIVPFVDARYRTVAEAASRAVVAAGFDGWSAAYAAFRHPGVFGAVGTQSLFMLEAGEDQLKKRIRTADEQPLRLYLDWGRYDLRATREAWDNRQMNRRFDAFLRERGYRPAGGEVADGFGWPSWRTRTDRLFETLFPARPAATP